MSGAAGGSESEDVGVAGGATTPLPCSSESPSTLECEDVSVRFSIPQVAGGGHVDAVRQVSVRVEQGRVLGIVGESGSGKSTLARVLVGLQRASSGRVSCVGVDPTRRSRATRRLIGRRVAMVFQDPRSSLNPRLSVAAVITDPLVVHRIGNRYSRREVLARLLCDVGLPLSVADRPVRTLSGGQLQRVAIARALALEPQFIVADEPTSALDVSIQAQILNLLSELRKEHQFGMLVISHDMRVMRFLCDEIAVMLDGVIVERGPAASIFGAPVDEYTRRLINSTPLLGRPVLEDGSDATRSVPLVESSGS